MYQQNITTWTSSPVILSLRRLLSRARLLYEEIQMLKLNRKLRADGLVQEEVKRTRM